jgi:hypothetical protein
MWGYHLRFVALPRELWVVNIHGYDTNNCAFAEYRLARSIAAWHGTNAILCF